MLDALNVLRRRLRLAVIMLRQPVDLFDIKNGVALHEGNSLSDLVASLGVGLGANDLVGINDKAPLFTLADVCFQLKRLLEGHPDWRGIALFDSCRPQHQDVNALIGNAVTAQRSRDPWRGLAVTGRKTWGGAGRSAATTRPAFFAPLGLALTAWEPQAPSATKQFVA